MLTTVRIDAEGFPTEPFVMVVRGFKGDINIGRRYDTMEAAWLAARKLGEQHRDWLTARSKGWGS